MKVMCPAAFAYGHAKDVYSDFGSELIPKDSDLLYEVEVVSCKGERWSKKHQVTFQAGKQTPVAPAKEDPMENKLSVKDEKKELSIVEKKVEKLKQDIVEMDKLVIKQEQDAKKIKVKVVSEDQKEADSSDKVSSKKKPEATKEEVNEKAVLLQKSKEQLH